MDSPRPTAVGDRANLTPSHEVVGLGDEVGAAIEDFGPGDRVVVGAITPDWGSAAAQDGHPSQSRGPLLLETDRVGPTRMTTHEFTFDGVDRAFELMESKEDGVIKPLVRFD